MAVDLYHKYHDEEEEDDYIDMEVDSFSNLYCHVTSKSPPPSPHDSIRGEFEFQMSLKSVEKELTSTSPADELFYKGKLLPLHLPPRLQMVEKLLSTSSSVTSSPFHTTTTTTTKGNKTSSSCEEIYSTPLNTSTSTTPMNGTTPFESCNVSPVESCQVSKELNIEEYLAEYASSNHEDRNDVMDNKNDPTADAAAAGKKLSWTRKLGMMRQPSTTIGSKLKASRSYLRILFSKSGCIDESSFSAAASGVAKSKDVTTMNGGGLSSCGKVHDKEYPNSKVDKKHPIRQIVQQITHLEDQDNNKEDGVRRDGKNNIRHRRSFSSAFIRLSSVTNKLSTSSSTSSSSSSSGSSSSSSSNNSVNNNSKDQLLVMKRSSSVTSNSEFESPIQGAIAYCKKSQKQVIIRPRKMVSEVVGVYSLSSSRSALSTGGDQDKGR